MLQVCDLDSCESEDLLEAQMMHLLDCTDPLSVGDDCEIVFEGVLTGVPPSFLTHS